MITFLRGANNGYYNKIVSALAFLPFRDTIIKGAFALKTKFLSFIAVITCLSFCCSPLSAFALLPELEQVVLETAFSEFISTSKDIAEGGQYQGYSGITQKVVKDTMKEVLQNARLDSNGRINLDVPPFDIITGKYQMTWDIGRYPSTLETVPSSIFHDDILIEVTMLLTDKPAYNYWDPATKTAYYSNALNISITRTNGSVNKYCLKFGSNYVYSRHVKAYPTYINVTGQSGCTLYSIGADGQLGGIVEQNFIMEDVRFNTTTENITTVNCNSVFDVSSSYKQYPTGIFSGRGNTISSPGIDYPIDKDICHGRLNFYYPSTSGNSSTQSFYCLRYLTCGFYTTNNPTNQGIVNQYWTTNSTQNYYNYPLTSGTVITPDNYLDLNLPSLAPVFDIDTTDSNWLELLLALIPDLLDLLDTDMLPNILDLLSRLLDYFGHMPEIGMEWNPDLQLNPDDYFELDFPSAPDDGGGGGGSGTITPWEPPEYPPVNTAPFIPATYPTIPTGTLPTNFAQNMGSVLQDGWDLFDHLEVLGVICPLVVIVLLWRITGK